MSRNATRTISSNKTYNVENTHQESDVDKHEAEELKNVLEERKEWDKLLSSYNSQATSAENRLAAVLANPDNPRKALHGVRRSHYVAPPTFKLNCEEVMEQVDGSVETAQRAVSAIIEHRRKLNALTEPNASHSTSILTASDTADRGKAMLRPCQSEGMNVTTFEKSTRSIISQALQ